MLKSKDIETLIEQELFLIKMLEHNRKFSSLIVKIQEFMSLTRKHFKQTKSVSTLDYFFPLLYEKLGIYYITEDKFRKFLYYMLFTVFQIYLNLLIIQVIPL